MYNLADYASMLSDPVRGHAYLSAVRETVREGSVFADIGAGAGFIGVYAAVLGARRVYLVEPSVWIGAATELARENGVLDRIEIFNHASTEVDFPEPAHVIVSDLRGVLPLFDGHLAAAADMRARLLAPGGICVPMRDRMMIALVEDPAMHSSTVGAWETLGDTLRHVSLDTLLANRWAGTHASGEQLLTDPAPWVALTYGDHAPPLVGEGDREITRAGTVHGLLCWFDTDLTETITLSNSPRAPRALYGQAYFPLQHPVDVAAGDRATFGLRAISIAGKYEWAWWVTIMRGTERIAAARHASLLGLPIAAKTIARRRDDFTPSLSPDARALSVLLSAVDGTRDLAALAAVIREAMPAQFASDRDALLFVSRHDSLWSP